MFGYFLAGFCILIGIIDYINTFIRKRSIIVKTKLWLLAFCVIAFVVLVGLFVPDPINYICIAIFMIVVLISYSIAERWYNEKKTVFIVYTLASKDVDSFLNFLEEKEIEFTVVKRKKFYLELIIRRFSKSFVREMNIFIDATHPKKYKVKKFIINMCGYLALALICIFCTIYIKI